MMNRGAFLAAAALVVLAAPRAAWAQPPTRIPRVGYLTSNSALATAPLLNAFRDGLRELGWLEGQNIALEIRLAEGRIDEVPRLTSELVRLPVDVFVASGPLVIRAAQQATATIPIVMAIVHEPVAFGFVKSLAHPGGNITGVAFQDSELSTKRLQLLTDVVPRMRRVILLWNSTGGGETSLRAAQAAAQQLGLTTRALEVKRAEDLPAAFASFKTGGAQAVIQLASPFFNVHRKRLGDLAASHHLPMTCEVRQFVADGCLMSYGPSFADMTHRAAGYVDKILKGAKPADLPVEQPTKFELAINVKTAKTIGVTIPRSVLLRADWVVEQ